jgi:hypothetical protein
MPAFPFNVTMTANGTATPLSTWQYRYLPRPGHLRVLVRASDANVKYQITSGSMMVVQESPVQSGGTAGVTPTPLNTPQIDFDAPGGDLIDIQLRETAGGTPTVQGIIYYDPY